MTQTDSNTESNIESNTNGDTGDSPNSSPENNTESNTESSADTTASSGAPPSEAPAAPPDSRPQNRENFVATQVGNGSGEVLFYNTFKGFGFIRDDSGGEDIFVHASALSQAGLAGLAEGQRLSFALMERNGKTSAANLVIEGELLPVDNNFRSRGGGGGGRFGGGGGGRGVRSDLRYTGERASGVVKFFNSTKGFGFITRDDGASDAFVHVSSLRRIGLETLAEGQRVSFAVQVDDQGKFAAADIELE